MGRERKVGQDKLLRRQHCLTPPLGTTHYLRPHDIGLVRTVFREFLPEQIDRMLAFCQSTIGDEYAFGKVMILGLRLVLGIWPSGRSRYGGPNRMIAISGCELVKFV
jgi:hypothetical protein